MEQWNAGITHTIPELSPEDCLPFDPDKNLKVYEQNGYTINKYNYGKLELIIDAKTGYFNLTHIGIKIGKPVNNFKHSQWFLELYTSILFTINDVKNPIYEVKDVQKDLCGMYGHSIIGYAMYFRTARYYVYVIQRMFESIRERELIENSIPKPVILSQSDDVFTDPTSGKQFKRYRYFDHIVIQDIETGLINAGKFVMDIARAQGISKELKDFKATSDYQICLEIQARKGLTNDGFIIYNKGYGNDVKGTYTTFDQFQLVALWADKTLKLKMIEISSTINNKANEAHTSAYDEMKRLNNQLQEEIEQLKSENKSLNLPINKSKPTTIYAKQINQNHFQLKHSKVSISDKVKPLKKTEVLNGQDVRDLTIKKLAKEGLVETKDRKKLIPIEQLDHCFDEIEIVKENKLESISIEERNKWIDNEIGKLKLRPQNNKIIGKIFELEYIKSMPDLIPWRLIPQSVLNNYNEQHRDTGVDAVKIKDGKITELYQIKHHSGGYVTLSEVNQFINKKITTNKTLILKDCRLSNNVRKILNSNEIEIVNLG